MFKEIIAECRLALEAADRTQHQSMIRDYKDVASKAHALSKQAAETNNPHLHHAAAGHHELAQRRASAIARNAHATIGKDVGDHWASVSLDHSDRAVKHQKQRNQIDPKSKKWTQFAS